MKIKFSNIILSIIIVFSINACRKTIEKTSVTFPRFTKSEQGFIFYIANRDTTKTIISYTQKYLVNNKDTIMMTTNGSLLQKISETDEKIYTFWEGKSTGTIQTKQIQINTSVTIEKRGESIDDYFDIFFKTTSKNNEEEFNFTFNRDTKNDTAIVCKKKYATVLKFLNTSTSKNALRKVYFSKSYGFLYFEFNDGNKFELLQ